MFDNVGYYEHRPGQSTLKKVLIIPSANLLILATVMCMPLNDIYIELLSREAALSDVKISSMLQGLICTSFAYLNNAHF